MPFKKKHSGEKSPEGGGGKVRFSACNVQRFRGCFFFVIHRWRRP